MIMTEEDYHAHCDGYDGYCRECDDVTNYGGVEPDATNYRCDVCGNHTVMGIEEALLTGLIEIEG